MVVVHCVECFGNNQGNEKSTYGMVAEFFGSFTSATVFMFLLGIGIHLSKNNSPRKLLTRGLKLFFAGYLLNLLRGALPMWVTQQITGDSEWIPGIVVKTMVRWSKNITAIYFVHWILIGWIALITDYNTMNLIETQLVTIPIFIVSDAIAYRWKKWRIHRLL